MSTDTKSKAPKRYFNDNENGPTDDTDLEAIQVVKKRHQKFEGEVISVEQKVKTYRQTRADKTQKKKSKIDQHALEKHSRGKAASAGGVKTDFFKEKLRRKEVYVEFANEQAARTEILRNEEEGLVFIYFTSLKYLRGFS